MVPLAITAPVGSVAVPRMVESSVWACTAVLPQSTLATVNKTILLASINPSNLVATLRRCSRLWAGGLSFGVCIVSIHTHLPDELLQYSRAVAWDEA